MLTAYLDESGHETKEWVFLAGFLGAEADWMEFAPKWKAGLGQRKSLHMSELRWKLPRTKKLLERLGPIPEEAGLIPVLGGARFADYEDLVSGTTEEKTLKGYMSCLFVLVISILRFVPDDQRVMLIFEQQKEYQPFADLALRIFADPILGPTSCNLTLDGKPKLAHWGFVPKGSTIMTDPADYFAFALREHHTNGGSKKDQWCSPILKSGGGRGIGQIMDREIIRDEIQGVLAMTAAAELDRIKAKFKQ